MLIYFGRHSRSLRGHYDATSGLIQNASMELKFDMNDPKDNVNIQRKRIKGSSKVIKGHYEVTKVKRSQMTKLTASQTKILKCPR